MKIKSLFIASLIVSLASLLYGIFQLINNEYCIGKILVNGKEPYPNENVNFESNLYWWLRRGDTTATITQAYVNYFTGQFTIVKLPPLIANKDELVPTTNSSSYSGKGGEINTIISPIREMIGDTLVLKTSHSISNKNIYTKIVLD